MSRFDSKSENVLALGLFALLVVSIVGAFSAVFAFGRDWLAPAVSVLRWDVILFSNAVLLFAIGWTDFPEKVRKSFAVKTQVQCLTIWEVLLGILVVLTVEQASYPLLFGIFGAGPPLIAYSAHAMYRGSKPQYDT